MLEEISSVEHIPEFVRRAKDKNDSFRLMGFGHRVYKNYDPRATVMRETCHEVLKELGTKDDLLQVAMELEHIALNDPYFIEEETVSERRLLLRYHPESDGYSVLHVYRYLRHGAYRGLDCALERNAQRWYEDRPSASAVYRLRQTRFPVRH